MVDINFDCGYDSFCNFLWLLLSNTVLLGLCSHGYTPLDEARVNDNEGTLKVLEAEVARQQLELHLTEDDDATSDDASSSSPMDELQEVGMQLKDGDHWWVSDCLDSLIST